MKCKDCTIASEPKYDMAGADILLGVYRICPVDDKRKYELNECPYDRAREALEREKGSN